MKKEKKNIFDGTLIVDQTFSNLLLANQILLICAFSLNKMSDIREVRKYLPLKDDFRSIW